MQEILTIPERGIEHEKEIIHKTLPEEVTPKKEMTVEKNYATKDLMAQELCEIGLTPQAISRLLNLKDLSITNSIR